MLSRFHQPVTQATRQLVNSVVKKSTQAAPAVGNAKIGEASEKVFAREDRYGAHNYHPLPVALCKGEGKLTNYPGFIVLSYIMHFAVSFYPAVGMCAPHSCHRCVYDTVYVVACWDIDVLLNIWQQVN
jgi:hypothetical protein